MARTSFLTLGLASPLTLFFLMLPACNGTPTPFPKPSSGSECVGSACPEANPCADAPVPCTAFDATTSTENDIQEALVAAQPNQTFFFKAGVYRFTNTVSVTVDGVTLQGAGKDKTTFDFTDQATGSEGVFATSNRFRIRDLKVLNAAGDGIKVKGASRVVFRSVTVDYTKGTDEDHGAYGLYPVQCSEVLIEDSDVHGASDAGIYVGQSKTIIVRNNVVSRNVTGIEIENSSYADVFGNDVQDNAAGLLVFDLPELAVKSGGFVRLFQNTVKANNHANFAKKGTLVSRLAAGTGLLVMANSDVEAFANVVTGNDTLSAAVVSYFITTLAYDDTGYYPYPRRVYLHDNTLDGAGANPDLSSDFGQLVNNSKASFGGTVANVLYDGFTDSKESYRDGNPMAICLGAAEAKSFGKLVDLNSDTWSQDVAPFSCSLDAVPAVTLGFEG